MTVSEAGKISSFSATGLALGTFATISGDPSYLTVLDDGAVLASLPDQDQVVVLRSSAVAPVAAEPTAPTAPTAAQPLTLSAPAPNPTTGRVSVRLAVEAPADVRAVVYDALGREVAVAFGGPVAESAEVSVDASRFGAGVYVLRVTGNGAAVTKTFTVVREPGPAGPVRRGGRPAPAKTRGYLLRGGPARVSAPSVAPPGRHFLSMAWQSAAGLPALGEQEPSSKAWAHPFVRLLSSPCLTRTPPDRPSVS